VERWLTCYACVLCYYYLPSTTYLIKESLSLYYTSAGVRLPFPIYLLSPLSATSCILPDVRVWQCVYLVPPTTPLLAGHPQQGGVCLGQRPPLTGSYACTLCTKGGTSKWRLRSPARCPTFYAKAKAPKNVFGRPCSFAISDSRMLRSGTGFLIV